MTRPAQVEINLTALRHNFSRVKALAPGRGIIAVVKADAYGHGLVRIGKALDKADALGVACLEEAMELREAGITVPIILLEGPYNTDELASVYQLDLQLVVHHVEQVVMLEKTRMDSRPVRIWMKIDSGMHRLGFAPQDVSAAYQRLRNCSSVGEISLMTHLANASDRTHPMTQTQLSVFDDCCKGLPGVRTIANSAGIIAWPVCHADYVRPGLMLYGVSPMDEGTATDHDLQAVMRLGSRLIAVKQVNKGESVGYGVDWCCPEDMNIGIVAIGYGDGYPRHATSGTPVMVNKQRTQIIGNVSMDMLTVDLRGIRDARPGNTVELWGGDLPVEEVARHVQTIPYELVCAVHKRLKVIVNE